MAALEETLLKCLVDEPRFFTLIEDGFTHASIVSAIPYVDDDEPLRALCCAHLMS
ncbi:hypothetical protein ACPF7Z_07370 [Halomonas sp. GXIMD04776]|uniref:hypothetical protein n=1 Tax=Halomonas sp. GXIMD04776 TaxID=3415605 RepID=UPI003C8C796A